MSAKRDSWEDRLRKAIESDDDRLGLRQQLADASSSGARVALEAIVATVAGRLLRDLDEWEFEFGSPLEETMYWALLVQGYANFDRVYVPKLREAGREVPPDQIEALWIEPQAQFGRYRVDFLVGVGQRYSWTEQCVRQLIVEVDGHDFHERTKEQARHDKQRDRALQDLGFRVLRFTGSEVWHAPLACAREALGQCERLTFDAIADAVKREREDAS